jgi:PAS domain-containing protein
MVDQGEWQGSVSISLSVSGLRKLCGLARNGSTWPRKWAESAFGIGTPRLARPHCSSQYGPLYGLRPGDVAPSFEGWLELIHPEDQVWLSEELKRVLESADHFSAEFRVVWPDGTIHWLYGKGQVLRDSLGNPIRVVGVNMDISERKRAEAALRESEERFRIMADTAPGMICASGPDKLATFFMRDG